MLFKPLLALLLVPFAAALPEPKKSSSGDAAGAKAVEADIKTIVADITTLNNTLNGFEPDSILNLETALQIQQQTQQLGTDIMTAIKDAKASKKWNTNQSSSVAVPLLQLTPKVKSLLNNIVTHKPAFASVLFLLDLSKTVEQSLEQERSLTVQFGDAVKSKLVKSFASLAPAQIKGLEKAFDKAIAAYKACTGLVCAPPM